METLISFLQTLIALGVHGFDLLLQLVIFILSFFLVIARMILALLHLG